MKFVLSINIDPDLKVPCAMQKVNAVPALSLLRPLATTILFFLITLDLHLDL